jgi:hypothetical protein
LVRGKRRAIKKSSKQKMKIENDKITISDWINYLSKIPETTRSNVIGLASLFFAMIAISSTAIYSFSSNIEGTFSLFYRIDKIDVTSFSAVIIFNFSLLLNE